MPADAAPAPLRQRFRETVTLIRAGVLAPAAPWRLARQLLRLRQFGPTLAGAYAAAAARAPRRCAVRDERSSVTYAQLDHSVRGICRGLAAWGVQPEDSVAILARNSVQFVEALVAVSRLGSDALLLSTFLSPPQVREVLSREQPRFVIVDPELLPLLDQAPHTVKVVTTRPLATSGPETVCLANLATGDAPEPRRTTRRGRLVVLTSGTTGTPKSARRPAPSNLGPAAAILSRLRLRTADTILIASPLFHTWGLGVLQIAPALAGTVVLRERADPEVVLEAIHRDRCTALVAVPVVLERLLQLKANLPPGANRTGLRVVASCGAPLTRDVSTHFQDAFGDVLYNVYGSTEISWATIATPADLRAAAGTAGRPPLGTRLLLLDDQDRLTPQGEVGRIFVGNELLFEGYTSGTEKEHRYGLMATGDCGYLDPEGRLMVVGREDDLIISGAEKIYPLEVEQVIRTLSGVNEVAVVGHPDNEMGQRLVAYVVCDPGTELTAAQVQDHVRARLARFAVPKQVGFVGRLPRTPTGKVVPRLLRTSV